MYDKNKFFIMDNKEKLEKIKNILNSKISFSKEVTEEKFLEMKDKDGNTLSVDGDALEIGQALMIVDENGESVPAEANMDYTLEDGSVITTDENGMIKEINMVSGEEENVEEEMSEETESSENSDNQEVTNNVENNDIEENENSNTISEDRIIALEEMVKELIQNQKSMTEATMSMVNYIEEFSKSPVNDNIDLNEKFSNEIEKPKTILGTVLGRKNK